MYFGRYSKNNIPLCKFGISSTHLAHLRRMIKRTIAKAHCTCTSSFRPSHFSLYISDFFSITIWLILTKLDRDEVFLVPYKYCTFSIRSPQGWIQVRTIIGHREALSLIQQTSTETNRLHINCVKGQEVLLLLLLFCIKFV